MVLVILTMVCRGRRKRTAPPLPLKKRPSAGKEYIMSYFEEMTQKAKAAVSTAAGKAREVADSAKISAAIIAEKRELDKSYQNEEPEAPHFRFIPFPSARRSGGRTWCW